MKVFLDQFTLSTISGIIEPVIEVKPVVITLGDLPEFLQHEEVNLDLANPQILFNVNNPLKLPLLVNAEMLGMKNGQTTHEKVVMTGDITIPENKKTTVILSQSDGRRFGPDTIHVQMEDLNNIFLTIPDSIKLDINAQSDPNLPHSIDLGQTETIEIDYQVNIPLAFGKDLHIVYEDTIKNLNKDIKNLEITRLHIEALIENAVPLEFHLSAYAIDVDGKKLEGLTVQIQDNRLIQPCKPDDSAETTPVVIEINTNTTNGQMQDMDGIVLRITANTTEALLRKPLKSSQYLMLKNVKAKIPGGIRMNLN
jgi:hypothetical protein